MWTPVAKQKSISSGIIKEKISAKYNHKSSKNNLSCLYLCFLLSREKQPKIRPSAFVYLSYTVHYLPSYHKNIFRRTFPSLCMIYIPNIPCLVDFHTQIQTFLATPGSICGEVLEKPCTYGFAFFVLRNFPSFCVYCDRGKLEEIICLLH